MDWKDAIVFISSTFNDMHAERDYLIKEVFPELTEWCEDRKIRLTDIDLRWGVTEEESNNSKTIETCLRHVDKSRPFFLCFLGQRRGWIPDFKDDIPEETKQRYTSIDELDGKSATEMEIEHALLKPIHMFLNETEYDCPPTKHSLFFFRNPSYVSKLSPSQKLIYTNDSEIDVDRIKLADDELEKTKQKIRDRKQLEDAKNESDMTKTNILITEYSGEWDPDLLLPELSHYENGEGNGRLTNFKCGEKSLKEVLISQLQEQIALAFPENMVEFEETEFERDLNQQEIFCYLNSEGFIPRPQYTQKLKEYVERDSNEIFLVSAEAGYGKTMLLSKFATDFNEEFPDKKLYKRFCGASDLSSDIYSLWKSIMTEAEISEDNQYYPKNLDELKRNISEILNAIAAKGDCVIIIDAVNQMHDGVNMIKWFDVLPDNLKLIMSVKEDRNDEIFNSKLQNIKNRNIISGFEIRDLDDDDKKDLINEYLKDYLKSLDDDQIEVICGFKSSINPLFLKVLLSELRVFGSFDQLKEKIQSFGESPKSAFKNVLQRLEQDENVVKTDKIVHLIFSLLANARFGLSEDELKAIIQSETGLDEKIVQDAIRINLRQVRPFMARKEGRHDFFYESFKIASQERYMDDKKRANILLANYFEDHADPDGNKSFNGKNIRNFNELPYHLFEAGEIKRLEETLSNFLFIKNKIELSDVYNLISDYEPFNEDDIKDGPLELIGRALELSATVLKEDKKQLSAQLWGRMNGIDDEIIKNLLKSIENNTNINWLKSTKTALYSPKSSIIKKFKAEGKSTTCIAITSDARNIIVGSNDGKLNLFDLTDNSLEILSDKSNGDLGIVKCSLIDDDKKLIVATKGGYVKLWDLYKQKILKTFKVVNSDEIPIEISDFYFSENYNKLFISSFSGLFSVNLKTGEVEKEEITVNKSDFKEYNLINVSNIKECIFVADNNDVDGWDIFSKKNTFNYHHQHEMSEEDLAFEETNVNSVENNDKIDSSSKFVTRMYSRGNIKYMDFIGRFMIIISENGQMKMYNILKNSPGGSIDVKFVNGINDMFSTAVIVREENQIITISQFGLLNVWSIPTPRKPEFNILKTIQTGIESPSVIDYYYNENNNWVIVGNEKNDINIIDLNKDFEEETVDKHTESVVSIKIHDNEMISASENGEIYIWDFDTENYDLEINNEFRNNNISYNYSVKQLICSGEQLNENKIKNMLSLWNINTKTLDDIIVKNSYIIDLANNASKNIYLEEILNNDETKLCFDLNNDEFITLKGNASTLCTIFDSDVIYIGFDDGRIAKYSHNNIEYFDAAVNSKVEKMKVINDSLVSVYNNGAINRFDLNGNHISKYEGHDSPVNNLCSGDNEKFITVSEDKTIKIWDLNSFDSIYTYYLDISARSVNMQNGKLVIGDTLGNVYFFILKNF